MEDQINRLRALEASSSSSPKGGSGSGGSTLSAAGGFNSLDASGVSARGAAAARAGPGSSLKVGRFLRINQ